MCFFNYWQRNTWSWFIPQVMWHTYCISWPTHTTVSCTCTVHVSTDVIYTTFLVDHLCAKQVVFYCYRSIGLVICYSRDLLLNIPVWVTLLCVLPSLENVTKVNYEMQPFRSKVVTAGSGATSWWPHVKFAVFIAKIWSKPILPINMLLLKLKLLFLLVKM